MLELERAQSKLSFNRDRKDLISKQKEINAIKNKVVEDQALKGKHPALAENAK